MRIQVSKSDNDLSLRIIKYSWQMVGELMVLCLLKAEGMVSCIMKRARFTNLFLRMLCTYLVCELVADMK